MVGTTLKDPFGQAYEILGLLGEGGFGEVYLARKVDGLDRRVAIKLLKAGVDAGSVARLRDEAKLLASLRHPAILAAEALVELWGDRGAPNVGAPERPDKPERGGRLALVTEFIEGQDLSACLADPNRMPESTLVEVVGKVAWALHAAWTEGRVVHRDVKPGNIRIGVHGTVKLLDFGIARSELVDREASSTRGLLGSLSYLAPERFDLGATPHPASDVFSLGCVLFQGVHGKSFFGALDINQIAGLALARDDTWDRFLAGRLQADLPDLPEDLAQLLRTTLARRPEERPVAGEVGQACEGLVARLRGHIWLERWCRERRWPERAGPPPAATVWSRGEVAPPTLEDKREPREPTEPPVEPDILPPASPLRRLALVGGGLLAFALLLGAGGLALQASRSPRWLCGPNGLEDCHALARQYAWGEGRPKDDAEANRLYGLACEGGFARACHDLAIRHDLGVGVQTDDAEANRLYEVACAGGVVEGCATLAERYDEGRDAPRDDERANRLYKLACEAGELEICAELGLRYAFGQDAPEDDDLANGLYQRACDGGLGMGCLRLGIQYDSGAGLAKDAAAANRLFQKACDSGELSGCHQLAQRHASGEGAPLDPVEANRLYGLACDGGDMPACNYLGVRYQEGRGVAKDPLGASRLYQKACDGGEMWGCTNLGVLYEVGSGVEQDYSVAHDLYRRACDGNRMEGCQYLGFQYEVGRAVPRDPVEAARLYRKACDGGYQDACR